MPIHTGSGFSSKESYLFGNIDMQIKLVPGDSAGTVTAYYVVFLDANYIIPPFPELHYISHFRQKGLSPPPPLFDQNALYCTPKTSFIYVRV